jgi:thiol-disulfide isomerase/thioredoxin
MKTLKHILPITLILFLTLSAKAIHLNTAAKGFEITIDFNEQQFDSVYINAFSFEKQYHPIYAFPFAKHCILSNNEPLQEGFYLLMGDKTILTYIIISDRKNQRFSISIDHKNIAFKGSEENSANINYIAVMENFDKQLKQIDTKGRLLQQQNLPPAQAKLIIDTLLQQMEAISQAKENYKWQMIKQFKGSLFASLVSASLELANPPKEYFADKKLFEQYYVTHFFDHFPWQDARFVNTIIYFNKIRQFCTSLPKIASSVADTFLTNTLNAVKPYSNNYFVLFDKIESIIGNYASPLYNEHLRIIALKNALSHPAIDAARLSRYKAELKRIDQNHIGDQVPDFDLVLCNGDSTHLYNIQSEYMILYLQNPDCPSCKEIRSKMDTMTLLNKAINDSKIVVLTLYFEDHQFVWEKYCKNATSRYLHGWNYNLAIEKEQLFDIQIIPYMFLLDKDKKVIKKDMLWNEIKETIQLMIND